MKALRRALALVLALCCLGFLPALAADEAAAAARTRSTIMTAASALSAA